MHAFAKHPSGSRPGAPGARLPSDRLALDPAVHRPLGPASARAQGGGAAGAAGQFPEDTRAQDGHGEPDPGTQEELAGPTPGGPEPGITQEATPGDPEPVRVDPGSADPRQQEPQVDAAPGARRPQGLRALLGLGPGEGAPAQQTEGKKKRGRKPGTAKAAKTPKGRDTCRSQATPGEGGPTAHHTGRIVQWLRPGGTSPTGPQGVSAHRAVSRATPPRQPIGLGDVPFPMPAETGYCAAAPGSSTDPPEGPLPEPAELFPAYVPGSRSPSPQSGITARRAALGSGHGSQAGWDAGDRSPPRAGRGLGSGPRERGAGRIPPAPGFVPDLLVPFPGGGGQQAPPRRGRRGTGQLEPD